MFKNPFSFNGRIRRTEYGISLILFAVIRTIIFQITWYFCEPTAGGDMTASNFITLFWSMPIIFMVLAQGAKRCHDIGKSGWWQIIPFYGLFLLFKEGNIGDNEYGSNPKQQIQDRNKF